MASGLQTWPLGWKPGLWAYVNAQLEPFFYRRSTFHAMRLVSRRWRWLLLFCVLILRMCSDQSIRDFTDFTISLLTVLLWRGDDHHLCWKYFHAFTFSISENLASGLQIWPLDCNTGLLTATLASWQQLWPLDSNSGLLTATLASRQQIRP